MNWLRGIGRFLVVSIGIIVLTSIGIDATQYFEGSGSALSILTRDVLQESCTEGTVEISTPAGAVCVDKYEASVGADCVITQPRTIVDTTENVNQIDCAPTSKAGAQPWTYVSYHQAAALCAKANKRLLRNYEWYRAALGTPDDPTVCNITGSLEGSGSSQACVSPKGMYDAIGNVWEWLEGTVSDGQYQDRKIPAEGYVTNADSDGIALSTATTSSPGFNDDYFWSKALGQYNMMRGGFYGSGPDAGLFSVHAEMAASFAGAAVGFRCGYDLF